MDDSFGSVAHFFLSGEIASCEKHAETVNPTPVVGWVGLV